MVILAQCSPIFWGLHKAHSNSQKETQIPHWYASSVWEMPLYSWAFTMDSNSSFSKGGSGWVLQDFFFLTEVEFYTFYK